MKRYEIRENNDQNVRQHEIIGATVKDVDDSILGKVVDVYRAGGADVVVVRGPAGEIDVALVKTVVRVFDPAKGEIVVDGEALGLRGDDDEADTAGAEAVEVSETPAEANV